MKGLPSLLLVVALLAAPGARAEERVLLEQVEGGWNAVVRADVPPGAASVDLWLPAGARVHHVVGLRPESTAEPEDARWRAAGAAAIRVSVAGNATVVEAAFDLGGPVLPDYVAPRPLDRLVLAVAPGPGRVVQSPAVAFLADGGDGLGARAYVATLEDVPAGARVPLRLVQEDRVGELGVLATVLLLGLAALGGGALWHRIRPPLRGRAPETFLDHLGELQARLLAPVVVFALLNVVYFVAGLRRVAVGGLVVVAPVLGVDSSLAARAFDAFAERLVPAGVQLVVTGPAQAVLAQVESALFLAFATTLPLLLYEVAAFVGPALSPRERRVLAQTVPLVAALFVAGALFGLVLMAPVMMRALYAYAPALGAAPFLVLPDLVAFALLVLFVFGLAFELPAVMYALARVGLVRAEGFRRYWRHAVVGIFLLAGFLTPDPSVVSQMLVGVPLTLLYLLGLGAARWGERRRADA